jgi:site-specific recombinase XerD
VLKEKKHNDIESISKMLGHIKLSTSQIYAKVVVSKLAGHMARLRDRLKINDENLTQ